MLTTAPNSAIPAALPRKKHAWDEAITSAPKHAAGIIFVAPDGDILLLRRSREEKNFGGHWGLPGGGVEDGETPELGAVRESKEEIGQDVDPKGLKGFDKKITPTGIAFHTFAMPVKEKFAPVLNDEHSGYVWTPIDSLPAPMHPAVEQSLKTRLGYNEDMTPEDWAGLRNGLSKWLSEEEEEHVEHRPIGDSALSLALDRDSVREYRRDGQMVVKRSHITKANVCPYRGSEIPGWQKLGLDPDKIYKLLRDPDELKKAAPTLNGVQLLIKHIPVNAEDPQQDATVGSLGTDAEFVEENGENYLDNSLFVNTQEAIDLIESRKQHELSAGYHYTPDMTPGNFRGTAFDGVMRDIVFNHVALVEDGRAGPDVVVGDSAENVRMARPTRLAAFTLAMTSAAVAPMIAMDKKLDISLEPFKGITSKNFKTKKAEIVEVFRGALDGKLRPKLALDASVDHVKTVLDALEGVMPESLDESVSEPQHKAMEAAAHGESNLGIPKDVGEEFSQADKGKGFDSEPLMNFLKEKGMGEDDLKMVTDMLPKMGGALAGDEEDEEAKKKAEEERKKKESAMDNKDMVTKPAMDEAIKSAVTAARETERGVHVARAKVKAWVGEIPMTMAFDSAASVYRHALKMRNVANAEKLHEDALLPILESLPKSGAQAPHGAEVMIAQDASSLGEALKLTPDLAGISVDLM